MPCHLRFIYFFLLKSWYLGLASSANNRCEFQKMMHFGSCGCAQVKQKNNRQFRRIFFQMSLNVKWFWLTGQFKRLWLSNDFIKLLLTIIFVLFFWSVTRRNCRLIKINSYRMSMHECFYWFIWMEKTKQINQNPIEYTIM